MSFSTLKLLTLTALQQYASLAALYVSSKMHDTLKKPQDILMVYYVVQSPELAARSRTMGGEVDMKPDVWLMLAPQCGCHLIHVKWLGHRARPSTDTLSGTIRSGNYLLQLYLTHAVSLRDQDRSSTSRYELNVRHLRLAHITRDSLQRVGQAGLEIGG
jgi:hypothetical protein